MERGLSQVLQTSWYSFPRSSQLPMKCHPQAAQTRNGSHTTNTSASIAPTSGTQPHKYPLHMDGQCTLHTGLGHITPKMVTSRRCLHTPYAHTLSIAHRDERVTHTFDCPQPVHAQARAVSLHTQFPLGQRQMHIHSCT